MVRALAVGVAALHVAAIAFMLAGGFLAWRWPRVVPVHGTVAGAILAVNLAGRDCPLTIAELWLRERAGVPPYQGGFIAHYLVSPAYAPGVTPAVSAIIYLVAVVPNAVAYGLIVTRASRLGPRRRPKPRLQGALVRRPRRRPLVEAPRRGHDPHPPQARLKPGHELAGETLLTPR